jgi:hypothetical protein
LPFSFTSGLFAFSVYFAKKSDLSLGRSNEAPMYRAATFGYRKLRFQHLDVARGRMRPMSSYVRE